MKLNKQFEINCPCCNEKIKLELKDGKLLVLSPTSQDDQEVKELLNELNIELG